MLGKPDEYWKPCKKHSWIEEYEGDPSDVFSYSAVVGWYCIDCGIRLKK